MQTDTAYCEEALRVVEEPVHTRTVLCGLVGSFYRLPGSPYEVALCDKHAEGYTPRQKVE